jgi:hypothetical protein
VVSPWDFKLNPAVEYELSTEMGAGTVDLDLSGLHVSDLSVETAVGKTEITIPEGSELTGSLDVAVGITTIYVPRGASVRIREDNAVVIINIPDDFTRNSEWIYSPTASEDEGQIDLVLSQAVGSISIEYLP